MAVDSVVLGLLHDGFEDLQIVLEGLATGGGQCVKRSPLDFGIFGDGHVVFVMERAKVRDQVAVTHLEIGLKVLETPLHAAGEEGHDREPSLLMDGLIDLGEVNHSGETLGRWGVAALGGTHAQSVNKMEDTKGHSHDHGAGTLWTGEGVSIS